MCAAAAATSPAHQLAEAARQEEATSLRLARLIVDVANRYAIQDT